MKITDSQLKAREIALLDPECGREKAMHAPMVSEIINRLQVTELLDYWCGRAWLVQSIKAAHQVKIQCYDPAMPGFAGEAIPMQMVACVDVLQDVEPQCLDVVLDDLERVLGVVGYFAIRQEENDARDLAWWMDRLMVRFRLQTLQVIPTGFFAIVYAKPKSLIDTVTVEGQSDGTAHIQ